MKHFLKKSALAAAVLAGLGSAQAATLTFEDPVDFPLFWNGDVFSQQGFELAPQNLSGDDSGFVGAIVNGADPGTCATVSCPTNNATNYYSSVNDGILRLRMDNGAAFRLNSFDASFLGASGETLPAVSGLLRIEFDRADGTYVLMQYLLNGPVGGNLSFASFNAAAGTKVGGTGTYTGNFTQAFFYGYACTSTGSCSAFANNRAQFALDNLNVTAVPEPSQWALMGLGLAAVGAIARRRKQQAA